MHAGIFDIVFKNPFDIYKVFVSALTFYVPAEIQLPNRSAEGYWELNMWGCVYTHSGKFLFVYLRKWLCGNIRFVPNWHTDWHHFLYPNLGSVQCRNQQNAFFAKQGIYLSKIEEVSIDECSEQEGSCLCEHSMLNLNMNTWVILFKLCVRLNQQHWQNIWW